MTQPTKAPICSTVASVAVETVLKPTGSKAAEASAAFYDDLANKGGVLLDSQAIELALQKEFVSAATALGGSLPKLGAYNRIESAMSYLLGWNRWLWQSTSQATGSGAVRQTLVERATLAKEMIHLLALRRTLPRVRSMQTALFESMPNVAKTQLQELLYDQIVIGNFKQLKNVFDSPLVLETLSQRFLKHQDNLDRLGVSQPVRDQLQALSLEIGEGYDLMRRVALQSGLNVEALPNGGYSPIQITDEFLNAFAAGKEQMLAGFKPLEAVIQKQRKTNLPVVADVETVARLWYKQLVQTNVDVEADKLLELSGAELVRVTEAAAKVSDTIDNLVAEKAVKEATGFEKLERSINAKEIAEVAKVRNLWAEKIKVAVAKAKGEAKVAGYSSAEAAAIAKDAAYKVNQKADEAVAKVNEKWVDRGVRAREKLQARFDKALDKQVQDLMEEQEGAVHYFVNKEKAKLKLLQIASTPGALSDFLATNFSEQTLKKYFDSGLLSQIPAMSDELTEFYRGFDLGVRGLSDAIVLDPVAAMTDYAKQLGDAAAEANLFKNAFGLGGEAGWVKAVVSESETASFIKVGNSPKLKQWLQGAPIEGIADLYIHKSAADQLNALMKVNTSPSALASAGQAWNSFALFNRRSMILGGGLGYVQRVFSQNVIALYAATGSLAQYPFAMIDMLRFQTKGFVEGEKAFTIGGTSYSAPELLREVLARRGGSAAASMGDLTPTDATKRLAQVFGFDKVGRERMQHFNNLHAKAHGDLFSKAKGAWAVGKDGFDAAYDELAKANAFLDNSARWAAVRELATQKKYASIDDLLRELDNYFSINADSGELGRLTSNYYMPFAQFAINAPGAALRHAINHPWRAANTMQLYATAQQTSNLTESDLPPWLRSGKDYFATVYKDPDTGNYHTVSPTSIDFMLDSYTWMGNLAREVSGGSQGVADYVESQTDPFRTLEGITRDLAGKSYLGESLFALMGVDINSLEKFSDTSEGDTVLGVAMPKKIRSLIVGLVPLLSTLDKTLPPALVGQAPQSPAIRFGEQLDVKPGTPSIFGNVPTRGGTRRESKETNEVGFVLKLAGISLTELDPQRNAVGNYKELTTLLGKVKTSRRQILRKLALEQRVASPAEKATADNLLHLETILASNRIKIDLAAYKQRRLPPSMFIKLDNQLNGILNEPLNAQGQELLLQELTSE
jgi:hypothetical protein